MTSRRPGSGRSTHGAWSLDPNDQGRTDLPKIAGSGPTDEYSACMDSHARAFKGTHQAEEVFLAADADCSRPRGLTERAAHAEWLRRRIV